MGRIAILLLVLLLMQVLLPPTPGQARPDQARPDQTQKDFILTLSWPERASYKSCEVLDTTIRKLVTRSSVLDGSQPILEGLRGGFKGSKVRLWGSFWMILGRF